jgi:hypothetical protein
VSSFRHTHLSSGTLASTTNHEWRKCCKASTAVPSQLNGDGYPRQVSACTSPCILAPGIRQSVSRGSVVGIASAYGLEDREVGVLVPVESRILDRLWGPPNLLSNGYSFPKGETTGGGWGANHTPPTGAKPKITWTYTSTPPVQCLIS